MRVPTLFTLCLSPGLLAQGADLTPLPPVAPATAPAAGTGFGLVHARLVLEDVIPDNQLVGVCQLDGKWYVSGGNNGQQPNKLYEYDALSRRVRAFDQPTTSDWGMRDLATDGRYIYGGDESLRIQVFDTQTGSFLAPVDVRSAASGNQVVRALAWFEKLPGRSSQPGFAFQDWSGPTVYVDMGGRLLSSHPSPATSCYGLVHMEWVNVMLYFTQTDPLRRGGRVHVYAADPATGQLIPGLEFPGDPSVPGTPPDVNGGVAGGIDIHIDGNRLVAACLHQAVRDTVVTYEIGVLSDFALEGSPCGQPAPEIYPNGIPDLLNKSFGVEMFSDAQGSAVLWMVGLNDRSWNNVPLPLSMRGMGLDCLLRTSPDIIVPTLAMGDGRSTLKMPVPGNLGLANAAIHVQAAVVAPRAFTGMSPKLSLRLGGVFANWKWRLLQEGCCALQIDAIYAACALSAPKGGYTKCVCDTIKDTTATWCCTKRQRQRYLKLNGC